MKYEIFDKNVVFVDGTGKHVIRPWGAGGQNPPKKQKKVSKQKK